MFPQSLQDFLRWMAVAILANGNNGDIRSACRKQFIAGRIPGPVVAYDQDLQIR
jgi:hypothetical protein